VDHLCQSTNGLQNNLTEARNTAAFLREKVHSLDMQRWHAQNAVSATQRSLLEVSNWRPTKRNTYTPEVRKLAHTLLRAGCAGDHVSYAIAACAKAFCICVTTLMSRQTVFRAQDEEGHFRLIQIGYEITQSKGQIPFIPHYHGIIKVSICQVLVKVVMGPQIIKSPTNRECHGLPWGFPGQPPPIPVKSCTRVHGYRWQVFANPWGKYIIICKKYNYIHNVLFTTTRRALPFSPHWKYM